MDTTKDSAYDLKRKVVIPFSVFTFGVFLNFSGYLVLLDLQSSINIEDGVGTASVTATYATAAVFGVVFTPMCLRMLGPKISILACEMTYLIYILINYYPAAYTLIPAGVIVGMAEATMRPVIMLFVVYYARQYAKYGTKDVKLYITHFIGIFYCVFQFSGVFGDLLNYGILYGGKFTILQMHDNSTTTTQTPVRDLSICGKNDCQDPNVTNANINHYVPASQTLLYILIGVMAGLVLAAMFIHFMFTKSIDSNVDVSELEENEERKIARDITESYGTVDETKIEKTKSIKKEVAETVKATLLHLINPKQLLITPFALYSGLQMSFGFSEITRAFGSCVLGVEQVGLLSVLAGGSDAIMSYVSCKVASITGRWLPMLFGFCLDICNYMICLFWIPTESSLWVVYIIFMNSGLIDGIWQPLINELHGAYFPEKEEIAFTVCNMYTLLGIAWQTGWCTSLCVYEKIYFQIAFLCFCGICYVISVFVHYRKDSVIEETKKSSKS